MYRDGPRLTFSAGFPADLDRHDRGGFGRGLRGHLFEPGYAPLATQVRAPVRAACATAVDGDSSHSGRAQSVAEEQLLLRESRLRPR